MIKYSVFNSKEDIYSYALILNNYEGLSFASLRGFFDLILT